MKADDTLTMRVPRELKDEVVQIAEQNNLTNTKAVIHLLLKAIKAYHEDGVLIDRDNRTVLQALIDKHADE